MTTKARIAALALALLVLISTIVGALGLTVRAAGAEEYSIFTIYVPGNKNTQIRSLTPDQRYTIEFEYTQEITGFTASEVGKLKDIKFDLPSSNQSAFKKNDGDVNPTTLELEILSVDTNGLATIEGTLSYARCRSSNRNNLVIDITSATTQSGKPYTSTGSGNYIIMDTDRYFENSGGGGSGGGGDDINPYSSEITIENVYITNSEGERIEKVDKESDPFTIVIIYYDHGLRDVDDDEFTSNSLEVYLTDTGGFVPTRGTKGTLRYMDTNSSESPRFRASFPGFTYNGGSTTVSFRANYDIFGWQVTGSDSAPVYPAIETEEDKKLDPLLPHIIVNQYSYGGEQIAAGEEFTLNLSMKNTSADIPLENIVMTIVPQTIAETTSGSTSGGLTITSASNTYYIESLGVGDSVSHTIGLRAEPNAAVGSHKVEIKFSFQYVDEVNKARKESSDSESIAIPVTQIDRFSVDPLTDIPEILYPGDDTYITVSFINRGKTTTYNITGTITGNMQGAGQNQHHGNLAAGESANLEFEITATEPGPMEGEIVIQYEDENTNQKEITLPFAIQVEQMDFPDYDPPDFGDMGMEEEPGPDVFRLVMCSLGGIMLAVPIMVYIHKRVKAKGIEDFDEDF